MPEIRPIKDLGNTTEISELWHGSDEPDYFTNGHLVVVSMEAYKEKLEKADLYEKLAETEMQLYDNEELLDAKVVYERLKGKYGSK